MRPFHHRVSLFIILFLPCLVRAGGTDKIFHFQKRSGKSAALRPENVQTNLYKPGKSLNYYWNVFEWEYAGYSLMTYTAEGRLSVKIDTGFQYRKTTYTYDSQQRETEKLEQNYNSAGSIWENDRREVHQFDAQGALQEYRSEQWLGSSWSPMNGEKHIRNYNPQNLLLEDLQQTWNMMDSLWENDYLETEYLYDNQSRLQSYVTKNWETSVWVNEEKSLWFYGPDDRPSQIILQQWNGAAFVDSNRITDISWAFWNGNLSESEPSQYTIQKLVGGNWTNFLRYTITIDQNGSETFFSEVYLDGNWIPATRSRYIFDEQQNQVLSMNEEYNPAAQSFDTVYCMFFQNTYDGQGRILEQIISSWSGELHQFDPISRQVFSQHSMFTSLSRAESPLILQAVPNPVSAGGRISLSGASGPFCIRDVSGKVLEAGTLNPGGSISWQALRAGLYLIEIQDREKGIQVIRFSVL